MPYVAVLETHEFVWMPISPFTSAFFWGTRAFYYGHQVLFVGAAGHFFAFFTAIPNILLSPAGRRQPFCRPCADISRRHFSRGLKTGVGGVPGGSEHPVDVEGSADRFTASKDTLRRGANPGTPDPKPALPELRAAELGSSIGPVPEGVDAIRLAGVRVEWGEVGMSAMRVITKRATYLLAFASGVTLKYVGQLGSFLVLQVAVDEHVFLVPPPIRPMRPPTDVM